MRRLRSRHSPAAASATRYESPSWWQAELHAFLTAESEQGWLCASYSVLSQPSRLASTLFAAAKQALPTNPLPSTNQEREQGQYAESDGSFFILRAAALRDTLFYRWGVHVVRAALFHDPAARQDALNRLLRFSQRQTLNVCKSVVRWLILCRVVF